MELKVHLVEGLLHVLDVNRCHLHEAVAVAKNGPDVANVLIWPERRAKQANRMQVLKPLAVFDVGLSAWNILHVAGINEKHFESSRL
jgi:hypothetical protein